MHFHNKRISFLLQISEALHRGYIFIGNLMQILPSKIKYFKEKWCFCMTWLKYLQIVDCNGIYVIHQVHETNFWCVGF